MRIAIVYKSLTGNTKIIAEGINEALKGENVVYFGEPNSVCDADLYFVGSWTDKGNCDSQITEFLKSLKNRKVAYFSTAGYGESNEYFEILYSRVKTHIDQSNEDMGHFFCPGKISDAIKGKYMKLLAENPEDEKAKNGLENLEKVASHPDKQDVENAMAWAKSIVK